jgi:DNA mismatch repair protein MutS2
MNDETARLLDYDGMKALFLPHMASDLGKSALRSLRPSADAGVIRRSLEEIAEAGVLTDRGLSLPFGGCHDLSPLLDQIHAQGRPFEPEDLVYFRETLLAAGLIARAVARHQEEQEDLLLPRLTALCEMIPGFVSLTDRIGDLVDERAKVRDDASPRLMSVRSGIRTARERIERRVAEFLRRKDLKGCFQESTARFRSGRVVLAIKAERKGEVRGILHDVSSSGATCFIEPEIVVAEGNGLEDLLAQERREVTRLLWETTVAILDAEREIRTALASLSRLDLARGAALAARARSLVLPELNTEGRLNFVAARHPVLEMLDGPESVVPIDIRLGRDFFLLVITGPNTGGKTVALKTLGLLVLMAQSGLPVPAQSAEFSIFREVFADIGDEQSLEQSLSTFSSHVSRIARFLDAADEGTLLLLDELGAGTDPAEGAALGQAILDYLHEQKSPAVVTTHLGSLKTYAFTHRGVSNASVEFDPDTLSPTYRLLIGQPGASNALTIAERLGVPESVIERARELVTPADTEGHEVLSMAQRIRTEAERTLKEAEGIRAGTRDLKEKAREEHREAERKREHVEAEAEEEMDATLSRIRRLVLEFAKEMSHAPKPFGPRAGEFRARAEEEIRATPLMQRREEFALTLHRGDEVYIPSLKERLQVHQVRKKDRKIVVIKGNLRFEVPFSDISFVES